MKIAVTSQNRKTVTEHAGRCRKFRIFTVEAGHVAGEEWLELPKEQAFHCYPAHQAHPLDGVDALISRGMGAGLRRKLQVRGIEAVITRREDPVQAVADYLAGGLAHAAGTAEAHS